MYHILFLKIWNFITSVFNFDTFNIDGELMPEKPNSDEHNCIKGALIRVLCAFCVSDRASLTSRGSAVCEDARQLGTRTCLRGCAHTNRHVRRNMPGLRAGIPGQRNLSGWARKSSGWQGERCIHRGRDWERGCVCVTVRVCVREGEGAYFNNLY